MLERKCTPITDIGKVTINYVVGMPQGQVLSVLNSNLLCNAKMGQWTAEDDTCKIKNNKGYSFASKDSADELHGRNLNLHKKSFSNDSTLVIHDSNQLTIWTQTIQNYDTYNTPCQWEECRQRLPTILRPAKAMVKRNGQFLVVCKIPRNGTKSVVWIINVHPYNADLVPESIKSFKYSWAQAKPREVDLPVK